jgi:deoxyribose-phosphate aldolase
MAAINDYRELAAVIDHTLLAATASEDEIAALCNEAKEWGFASVCVNPRWVSLAADLLEGTKVNVCSVISFPFGTDTTKMKAGAAEDVIFDGADEVDMVADLAAIRAGDHNYLTHELREVLAVCREIRPAAVLKVILETAALEEGQKRRACRTCAAAGVDFIKTSTGFHSSGGATVADVRLLKQEGAPCKVKASGGIRTVGAAMAMLEAGADRLGCSASVAIVSEFKSMMRNQ